MSQREHKADDVKVGFGPVVDDRSRVLVLGTMPGEASLAAGEYYGHPRNVFWPIMAQLLGGDADVPYEQRLVMVRRHGVGLWDVMERCRRAGSLDSAIERETVVVNDLVELHRRYPAIRAVFFNGTRAEADYKRSVWPSVRTFRPGLQRHRLPSTSPARATLTVEQKLAAWRVILDYLDGDGTARRIG